MGPNDIQNEIFVRLVVNALTGTRNIADLRSQFKDAWFAKQAEAAAEIAKILADEYNKHT